MPPLPRGTQREVCRPPASASLRTVRKKFLSSELPQPWSLVRAPGRARQLGTEGPGRPSAEPPGPGQGHDTAL